MPLDQTGSETKADFAHILWIGGASDAGKTTVARLLAERHRWQWYPCDFHEHNHLIARADPERQPAIYTEFQKSVEERWIQPTPEDLFQGVLETNDERLPMILDDLRVMPQRPMILVEGPRLFPKIVAPLLTSPHQAVWLMPTPEFARESVERRDKPQGRFETSDPERYRENFLRRDAAGRVYPARSDRARANADRGGWLALARRGGRSDRRALCALPHVALRKLNPSYGRMPLLASKRH